MKDFADILRNRFGLNQPILASEIKGLFPDVFEVTIYQWIDKALEGESLRKYRRGVYYLPKKGVISRLGEMKLSPDLVLQKQYIRDEDNVYGYRSGLNLENEVGISPQHPATLEITTNNASKRVRDIEPFGGYKAIKLRKPRVEISEENVDALRFLDLITQVPLVGITSLERERFEKFAKTVDKRLVIECLGYYPAKTSKRLIESEYLDVLAS